MVPGKLPLYLEGDAPEIGAETRPMSASSSRTGARG